jgi:hypothetical protein
VPVFGAVVDQQQQAGRRQALNQAVEERLRLGIDPVEVFDDEQHGVGLALAEQQALHRIERALPTLRRVERLPGGILPGHVQQGE